MCDGFFETDVRFPCKPQQQAIPSDHPHIHTLSWLAIHFIHRKLKQRSLHISKRLYWILLHFWVTMWYPNEPPPQTIPLPRLAECQAIPSI